MNIIKLTKILFLNIVLAGCGGNTQGESSIQHSIAPAPTNAVSTSVVGPRNNFRILRTQENTILFDKSNQLAPVNISNFSQVVFSDLHVNLNVAKQAHMLNTTQIQSLIELYVAFFSRVPDADGLCYWMNQLEAGETINQIAEHFYQAGLLTSEYTGYSRDMSNSDFIKKIYKSVLGRTGATTPSEAEISYWANAIQSGQMTRAGIVIAMLNSARLFANDPDYGWVTRLLDNKIKVGQYFAMQQGLTYETIGDNITRGMDIIAAVTPDDISKAVELIGIDDPTFDASISAPEPPQNIKISAENAIATFKFDTPSGDGGSPITRYDASCSVEGTTITASGSSSPIYLSNILAGKTYSCYMKSNNRYGYSINSTPSVVQMRTNANSAPFNGDVILGAPTTDSIRIKILSPAQGGYVSISYGINAANLNLVTSTKKLEPEVPLEFQLEGLPNNSQIFYAINFQSDPTLIATMSRAFEFRTAKPTGASFSFTIQADSHLDENSNLTQYQNTLDNIQVDRPDFHIDLGDTFMTEKHIGAFDAVVQMATSQEVVNRRYIFERQNFGRMTHSVPLFLVNGNHEGELGWLYNNTANNLAVWASIARQSYFVTPTPGIFYSGDQENNAFLGQRGSWYSWQWGDALFVALDPYWNSKAQASKDGWNLTLGETQYRWLANTLKTSKAKLKFVFLHNLVGGLDGQMRGGIEAASFYEWGGKNSDGSYGFDLKRPGWELPIHQLLVNNKVTAVFHGHDHLYARQMLDGILYQEVPQPSAANNTSGLSLAKEYHYNSGVIQSSSGHLRVTVSPSGVKGEYIRSWLPTSESSTRKNRQIDDSWLQLPIQ